jgi:hypothetical protein
MHASQCGVWVKMVSCDVFQFVYVQFSLIFFFLI